MLLHASHNPLLVAYTASIAVILLLLYVRFGIKRSGTGLIDRSRPILWIVYWTVDRAGRLVWHVIAGVTSVVAAAVASAIGLDEYVIHLLRPIFEGRFPF